MVKSEDGFFLPLSSSPLPLSDILSCPPRTAAIVEEYTGKKYLVSHDTAAGAAGCSDTTLLLSPRRFFLSNSLANHHLNNNL